MNASIITDLQLHSKYSRAVSPEMTVPTLAEWGRRKGINLLATGDWMHPLWFRELQAHLNEVAEGIFSAKADPQGTRFLLSAEISSIYSQDGAQRRVHTLVFAPSFKVADRINQELVRRGANLSSDGRPIVGLSCRDLAEIVFTVDQKCLVIPAHAWTPWYSLYGSKSGFDSIAACFGEFADRIWAVETGLSSDPAMNWRISQLDDRAIVSFSDAHSPPKLGREATVFQPQAGNTITSYTYADLAQAVAARATGRNDGRIKLAFTIEFYPQEGKYHYTGHRSCQVIHSPADSRRQGTTCPVCGRQLTVGVMHRVDELADPDRAELTPRQQPNAHGVTELHHPRDATRPPFVSLVPLPEILAELHGVGVATARVAADYRRLTDHAPEFELLLVTPPDELARLGGERLAEAIRRVRSREVTVSPGYDGVFGTVSIWGEDEKSDPSQQQMSLL